MQNQTGSPLLVRAFVLIALLWLIIPVLIVIPMSFSSARFLAFPPPGWSLRWYQAFLGSPEWMAAARTSLIVAVAAFNLVSTLVMTVTDKRADIAILRTMGATRGAVLRVFFLSGASIGIVGTLMGFVLGLLFALNVDSIRQGLEGLTGTELWSAEIRFLSQLPAKVETDDVLSVIAMGLVLSFLATIYPARRAARTAPAEALRYE